MSEFSYAPELPEDVWSSRGYLPHVDQDGATNIVTFRLADSLPGHVISGLDRFGDDPRRQGWEMEGALDVGHGACWLRMPAVAEVVENALLHFDGERYRLIAWVVMPNHVHALLEALAGSSLGRIVGSWKSFTARAANEYLGRSGRFWYPEYHDRYIRDADHLRSTIRYIHENPVKAGLVVRPRHWRWSSARRLPYQRLA